MALIQTVKGKTPQWGERCFLAENATLAGDITMGDDLNRNATRVCAVLNPVKVVITNYPDDKVELLDMDNNPEQENAGTHKMPFSRELYIERDDFMGNPPKKFFRLTPGKEVRLKGGYIIMCTGCSPLFFIFNWFA